MSLKLPVDFAKKICETFNWKMAVIEETFDLSEDKEGFFWAKLRPKKFLGKPDFRTMCTLVRDLKGEDYLEGARAWKVPGPFAKKGGVTPQASSTPAPGVAPNVVKDDKSKAQIMVPVKALSSLPFQSRTRPEVGIDELAESIRAVGVLHPILVRPKTDGLYEVVMGERRVAATKKLGLVEIPANIRILNDKEAYEIQFTENIQREDLTDIEKAHWLYFMIKRFGYTQRVLADKLGKAENWISRHLAMLDLEKLTPGKVSSGEITERQAREILAAPEEKKQEIIDEINKTGEVPSAREIRNIVHPEEAKPLKPQDMTPGKARELLESPVGKEVLEAAVKERLAEGPVEGAGESEEEEGPLYADSIETVPEESKESIPNAHEPSKESIPRPMEKVHAKDEKIDTGFEFCCPECQLKFQILHVKRGDGKIEHRLEAKG